MLYDKIIVVIIILFSGNYIIEIETHNYLIHVSLYKSLLNLNKHIAKYNVMYKCLLIFGRPFVRRGLKT